MYKLAPSMLSADFARLGEQFLGFPLAPCTVELVKL